jgi:hypothetical protein
MLIFSKEVQNYSCPRHNATLTKLIKKILKKVKCIIDEVGGDDIYKPA